MFAELIPLALAKMRDNGLTKQEITEEETWLKKWSDIRAYSPGVPQVPTAAQEIYTPLICANWSAASDSYRYQPLVKFMLSGLSQRFRVCFNYRQSSLKSASKNLNCALEHKEVVDEYLENELSHHRLSGPFWKGEVPGVQISRFGVILKNYQPDKWRLIVNLRSQQDIVSMMAFRTLCSLSYMYICR